MSEMMTSIVLVFSTVVLAIGLKKFFINLDKSNNPTTWYDENKNYDVDEKVSKDDSLNIDR